MVFTYNTTHSRWRHLCCGALLALLTACGGTNGDEPELPVVQQPNESEQPVASEDCAAPNHLALYDIESVTDWINAMPKPLELPCFLESLPRPFYVNMTESVFSAQPSNGAGNPRIFLFFGQLMLSVVPQENFTKIPLEKQHNLLEMSFNTEGIQSIKAEIAFPVLQELSYGDAYTRMIIDKPTSSCGVCHANEIQVGSFDDVPVFQSQMLRPYDNTQVTVGLLKNEARYCDAQQAPHRCAMLEALVGEGDIFWQEFPADVPILP